MMVGCQYKNGVLSSDVSSNSRHISRIKSKPCFGRGRQCAPSLDISTSAWQQSTGLRKLCLPFDQSPATFTASWVLGQYEMRNAAARQRPQATRADHALKGWQPQGGCSRYCYCDVPRTMREYPNHGVSMSRCYQRRSLAYQASVGKTI